jgi:hypothetical protein
MPNKIEDRKRKLIDAGYKAVDELIKVAEAKILKYENDDELGAEKMKNAAAAKRLALEDAFDILDRIQKEEEELDGPKEEAKVKVEPKKTDFLSAEARAKK